MLLLAGCPGDDSGDDGNDDGSDGADTVAADSDGGGSDTSGGSGTDGGTAGTAGPGTPGCGDGSPFAGDFCFGDPVLVALEGLREPRPLAVGDIDGDGFADVATSRRNGAGIEELSGGAGGLTAGGPTHGAAGARPRAMVSADFDGDGTLDYVVAGGLEGTTVRAYMSGSGYEQVNEQVEGDPAAIAVLDYNGDGDFGDNQVQFYRYADRPAGEPCRHATSSTARRCSRDA